LGKGEGTIDFKIFSSKSCTLIGLLLILLLLILELKSVFIKLEPSEFEFVLVGVAVAVGGAIFMFNLRFSSNESSSWLLGFGAGAADTFVKDRYEFMGTSPLLVKRWINPLFEETDDNSDED
jgi:hypothetical protein